MFCVLIRTLYLAIRSYPSSTVRLTGEKIPNQRDKQTVLETVFHNAETFDPYSQSNDRITHSLKRVFRLFCNFFEFRLSFYGLFLQSGEIISSKGSVHRNWSRSIAILRNRWHQTEFKQKSWKPLETLDVWIAGVEWLHRSSRSTRAFMHWLNSIYRVTILSATWMLIG